MRNTLTLAAVAALAFTSIADAKTCADPTTHKDVKCPAPAAGVGLTLDASTASRERAFLAENQPVMDRMMVGMAIKPAHDIDRDFAGMMIPHHQGAIDMAVLELRFGRNERLRRIAQEIIIDQEQEIIAMRLALGDPLPPSAPAPTQSQMHPQGLASDHHR